MKIVALLFFCAALFLTVKQAFTVPLAYFAFFPFGFLVVFYFYALKEWIFFAFSFLLLLLSSFLSGHSLPAQEAGELAGITLAAFALFAYYQRAWEAGAREETARCQSAGTELEDLKKKHGTREESLFHLEKQVASLINLFEIARDFNECLNLKETVLILYKKVMAELPFEQAELILLSLNNPPLAFLKAYLINRQGVEEKDALSPESPETDWLAKSSNQKGFIAVGNDWLFPLMGQRGLSALFVVQGASKDDLAKFEVLAAQLALQVRKVRLYEMVRELSIIDGLTGVFVRRHFLERFEEEIKRALKQNFPLTVLMLDIDHFKRYNDDFGHLVGDATLKEVAQIIRANVRNVDIVARYGGEEFVVVIPETREEGGIEVAERIRSAVARKAFRVYDEETKVTVSIGISVFPQDLPNAPKGAAYDPKCLFELLHLADRALYRAKEEGRNRVILHRALGER